MIKNAVFDLGQVMLHFNPSYMVKRYVSDEQDADLLTSVLFDRLYWDRLDEGTMSNEEAIEAALKRLPERLHPRVTEIFYNWIYNLPEIDGMGELVDYIKEKYGVRTFVLSDISAYFAEHAGEIPVLSKFDKCIFSGVCGHVKPSREIFEHLFTTCGISPEESVFVDDREKNIQGAEALGMKGYIFDGDVKALRKFFDEILG